MSFRATPGLNACMNDEGSIYTPGDPVLALQSRAGERYWRPGVVRSVGASAARVDLGEARPRRIPYSRLRMGAGR
jgi:hypothetical protein